MPRFQGHRLLFAISLVLAVGLGFLFLIRLKPSIQLPPNLVFGGCVRDPAGLPPPNGPEGKQANYLHTCGNRLYDAQGRMVKISGLNWYGMESASHAPEGLGIRKWQELLDQSAALGYNTIRLPFSNDALEPGRQVGGINLTINPDLDGFTGLEMLDRLIDGARDRGLKIILDRHQPTSAGRSPLWYTYDIPEERWIADWVMLASRYYGNDTVIGVDLHNEPRGEATWGSDDPATDWRLAAERAGNAVLKVNPYLLILVEGIENYNGDHFWWGGDLQGVRSAPVRLRVPNRVVYSPHDYGPNVSGQVWFWDPRFPENLPTEWDRRWGYIHRDGIAPVVLGEFGGYSVGNDPEGQWQTTLLAYLKKNDIGALVWALNPSWDVGGILHPDWETVQGEKQRAYQQILAPPIVSSAEGSFGRARGQVKVLFRQDHADHGQSKYFAFKIMNDGPEELDLSHLELRYWFKAGDRIVASHELMLSSVEPDVTYLSANLIPIDKGGQDHYLRIGFSSQAGTLSSYQASGEITVRYPETGWPNQNRSEDYSFAKDSVFGKHFREWDRVTLYFDGQLVWGLEP